MKQSEFEKCFLCDRGVMHNNVPVFYRVTLETFGIDANAVMRQHGLEQFFHKAPALAQMAPALAQVMGPNDDLANPIGEPHRGLLCMECATGKVGPLLFVIKKSEEVDDDRDPA